MKLRNTAMAQYDTIILQGKPVVYNPFLSTNTNKQKKPEVMPECFEHRYVAIAEYFLDEEDDIFYHLQRCENCDDIRLDKPVSEQLLNFNWNDISTYFKKKSVPKT